MRSYGEPIDVRTHDPDRPCDPARPAQFVWRGRLYLVRTVLAHWVELGTWWTARGPARSATRPATGAGTGTGTADGAEPGADGPGGDGSGTADGAAAARPRSVAADVGAVEREVWRVEASRGRAAAAGVFDLVRDVPAVAPGTPDAVRERWRLARALD